MVLSDVEEGNNLMSTRLTPVATQGCTTCTRDVLHFTLTQCCHFSWFAAKSSRTFLLL